ncbi:hypothetical protein [Myroides sp. DW712]|uniref:hypothetical protein n=1 Tax=Myroides sp. DW712 TaxID=3389800 RepID=UPI00397A90F0
MKNYKLTFCILISMAGLIGTSCKKKEKIGVQIGTETVQNIDTTLERKYNIGAYGFNLESDTIPAFSMMPLRTNEDFIVRSRMAFLENRFGWDFKEQLDSAYVFGIKENMEGKSKHINVEIWHKLNKNKAQTVIDSLDIIFDTAVYYKPPIEWYWFTYKDHVFFMDAYGSRMNQRLVDKIRVNYEQDTLFLNAVLRKIGKL